MEGKAIDPLRQHILEAVDCLRQRKCRPDRESIAHYVLRKFGSTMNEIFAELENIVDENGLIKVEYKGTTSYRSPSSFDTKNSPLLTKHSKILNSSKTTRFILTGINELLVKDPNYAKEGVPLHELKEALVGFDGVRFGEENMDVVLEREKNYGNIQIAKSTVFTDSLRVFPKDIPVPADMLKFSLSNEIAPGEKEDKKPRKPRKNAAAAAASAEPGTSPVKKGKTKVKKEEVEDKKLVAVFAVKSEPPPPETETDELVTGDELDLPPKKNARLTSAGRKTVVVQVAEAVRRTYEAKSDFENKSAQMIKLAAALVSKQVDETPKQKGPVLVLAESIKGKTRNGEASHMEDPPEASAEETSILNRIPAGGKKRRGRPPAHLDTDKDKDEDSKDEVEEDEEMDNDKASPTNDQGLTRSKRDKRKKQVFDPSDLPKTYSNYSSSTSNKSPRKSRTNRSPSYEEPPAKKTVVARPSRASQRKSLPVESEEKRVSRSNSKKLSDESQTNKSTQPVENPENELSDESELMDIDNTETAETQMLGIAANKDKEAEKNNVQVENKISGPEESEVKSIPSSNADKRCEYCPERKKDSPVNDEEFLSCASCLANIHPRCMDYSSELTTRIREFDNKGSKRIPWKCFKCKTCGACQQKLFDLTSPSPKRASNSILSKAETAISSEKGDKSNSLQFNLCEHCDVGFHSKCIKPEISVKGEAWICQECKAVKNLKKPISVKVKTEKETKKSLITGNKTAGRSLRRQSAAKKPDIKVEKQELATPPITKFEIENPKIDEKLVAATANPDTQPNEQPGESETLDITSWSPSEVEAFFIDKGLKDEAAILREQDVDGYSLLLLRREDIIHGLRLRLGPALKVNRLIDELQSKAPVRAKWHDAESTEPEADVPVPETSQR